MRLASIVAEEFHFGGVQRYEYLHLLHIWHLPTKLACEAHLGKQSKDAFYIKLNRNLDSRTTALEDDAARIPKGSIGGRPIEVNGGGGSVGVTAGIACDLFQGQPDPRWGRNLKITRSQPSANPTGGCGVFLGVGFLDVRNNKGPHFCEPLFYLVRHQESNFCLRC